MSAASVIDLVAGSAGGAAAIAVGQPLDTIKVREYCFIIVLRSAI